VQEGLEWEMLPYDIAYLIPAREPGNVTVLSPSPPQKMKRRICLAWFGDLDGSQPGGRVKSQAQSAHGPSANSESAPTCPPKDKERPSELRRWIRKN